MRPVLPVPKSGGGTDGVLTPEGRAMTKGELEEIPLRSGYGHGRYRRCIVLEASRDEVRSELADDFHHFGVSIRHAGGRVTAIEGADVRVPWTTCPGALVPLRRMKGTPLSRSLPELLRRTPAREQCTHLHDLACLAIAHAARVSGGGAPRRRYDATIPDQMGDATPCELERDGELALGWQVRGFGVERAWPDARAAPPLRGPAFYRFLLAQTDADLAEAAWVLQRALFIGAGRRYDFERIHRAKTFARVVGAACHTFEPQRVGEARRVYGTLRDFSASAERILERDAADA